MNGKKIVEIVIGLVSIFLFIRLLILIVRVIGGAGRWAADNVDQLVDGSFLNQLLQLLTTPQQIVIIVVVLILNLLFLLSRRDRSEEITDEGIG
jgi:hypothetical protein